MIKTNVMRLLDAAKIEYEVLEYPVDENDLSGESIARKTGKDHTQRCDLSRVFFAKADIF